MLKSPEVLDFSLNQGSFVPSSQLALGLFILSIYVQKYTRSNIQIKYSYTSVLSLSIVSYIVAFPLHPKALFLYFDRAIVNVLWLVVFCTFR